MSPSLSFIEHQVLILANTGISNFLDNMPAPFIWSTCSCVINIPFNLSASTSMSLRPVVILLPLNPASTSILVFLYPI